MKIFTLVIAALFFIACGGHLPIGGKDKDKQTEEEQEDQTDEDTDDQDDQEDEDDILDDVLDELEDLEDDVVDEDEEVVDEEEDSDTTGDEDVEEEEEEEVLPDIECEVGFTAMCKVPPGDPSDKHMKCIEDSSVQVQLDLGSCLNTCNGCAE